MARDDGVSVLFAEPSGIVIPFELRTAISAAGRDVPVTVGPVVLLLNGSDPEMLFGEGLGHITAQQIAQADMVAITKIDSALEREILRVEDEVARLAPQTDPHHVSMQSGEGVAALVESILGPDKLDQQR
jgi:G3E family GTPase